jgi:DHA1 family tetracycline resistance protein-like MFS transporter
LMLGRALAGLTSANVSIATAYLTDVTPEAAPFSWSV